MKTKFLSMKKRASNTHDIFHHQSNGKRRKLSSEALFNLLQMKETMKFSADMTVKDIFFKASNRIDGIAMYVVCLFFVIFGLYAFLAGLFNFPLYFLSKWKSAWEPIILAPITCITYATLAYFSVSGFISRISNAIILLSIPIMFIYKSIS